jgi:hypothetical protein
VPCKGFFPHLVEMQRKFGDKDFVVLAVSIDDPKDKDDRAEIDKFLASRPPNFKNYILTSSENEWGKKLGIKGPPCMYLFDRSNFHVKKYTDEPEAKEMEAEIEKLLRE